MNAPPWDEAVDLIVVGAGAGGMTAAIVGAECGLSVLLLEKAGQVGGSTSTSAGTVWVPGTNQSRKAGVPDSLPEACRYLEAEVPGSSDDPVMAAFASTGAEAIDFLEERTDVRFVAAARHPDYHPGQPGAALGGRALVALPFDGRKLGREFTVLGGMMVGKDDIPPLVAPFSPSNRSGMRHGCCCGMYPTGSSMPAAHGWSWAVLWSRACSTACAERTYGLCCTCRWPGCAGTPRASPASSTRKGPPGARSVPGAAWCSQRVGSPAVRRGGTACSPDCRSGTRSRLRETQGDGLALGTAAGGVVTDGHASPAFWMPSSVMKRRDGSEAVFPHIFLDRAKPGLIAVNQAGRRFVNEAASYHDFVAGMLRSHQTVPTIPAWLVCDSVFLRRYGLGMVHPGARNLRRFLEGGYLVRSSTLAKLADHIGVDPNGLEDSVEQHNGFALRGIDEAFGKGSNALNRHNGDPGNQPNPCLRPITLPPSYAMAIFPADLATSRGLATDSDARVLDENGNAVPGLYACGNDMSSVMQGVYPGPGVTLGPAIVFGYRAASHATRRNTD